MGLFKSIKKRVKKAAKIAKATTLPGMVTGFVIDKFGNTIKGGGGGGGGGKGSAPKALTQEQQLKAMELQAAKKLQDAMEGKDSIAELQAKKAREQIASQAQSMTASARGVDQALAQRAASQAASQGMLDVAQQEQEGKLQERYAAAQALMGKGQDIRGAELERERLKEEAYQAKKNRQYQMTTGIIGGLGAGLGAAFSDEKLKKNKSVASAMTNKLTEKKKEEDKGGFSKAKEGFENWKKDNKNASSALAGVGAFMKAFSDEDVKTDEKLARAMMDKLKPYSYNYKDEKMGEGKQFGVMAQDLEKTEAGKQAVVETPEGKMVDYGKLAGAMMAALAEQNKRLKKVEDKNGKS